MYKKALNKPGCALRNQEEKKFYSWHCIISLNVENRCDFVSKHLFAHPLSGKENLTKFINCNFLGMRKPRKLTIHTFRITR